MRRSFSLRAAPLYRVFFAAIGLLFVFLVSARVEAYPFLQRNGYQQCQGCHVDPSGSGPLTGYGRAIGQVLLPMQLGQPITDATPVAGFLFGLVDVPPPLLLGGDIRVLQLAQKAEHVELQTRLIYMQLDFEAAIATERFVAMANIGYAPEGALGAAITRGTDQNLVSRQHWIGYRLDPELLLLRAGRLNLPFGIRNIEHTLWARTQTRTNINDHQQYGLALSLEGEGVRGELMAIAGNLQVRPDEFRERGYSGYFEVGVGDRAAIGVSSLLTYRALDSRQLRETYRHAHGAFLRWATPYRPLVLLSELDYVLESAKNTSWRDGIVGYVQGDFEAAQGIHFILTGEAQNVGVADTPFSWATWFSYAWFFAPHCDLRLDAIYQNLGSSSGRTDGMSFLIQGHIYL